MDTDGRTAGRERPRSWRERWEEMAGGAGTPYDGPWRNPGRHLPDEVMEDWWFDTPHCNRILSGEMGAKLLAEDIDRMGGWQYNRERALDRVRNARQEGGEHATIGSIIGSHLAGAARPPDAAGAARAFGTEHPSREQRTMVRMVASEMDTFSESPVEGICVCVEEGLSLRQLARALRSAGVTNARVVEWLNAQGGKEKVAQEGPERNTGVGGRERGLGAMTDSG